jgi:hypothetical protein
MRQKPIRTAPPALTPAADSRHLLAQRKRESDGNCPFAPNACSGRYRLWSQPMLISDAPPLLFIHIPKAAGTSLSKVLAPERSRRHCLCLHKTQHETAAEFTARCGIRHLPALSFLRGGAAPARPLRVALSYLKPRNNLAVRLAHIKSIDD